ncbi:hypothetical protein D9613_007631 [Agrocybe pediades]|uniref:C2 domain-containing protein n=1 Tax=Agrocybe pediades TaxID=84607 RepID=A0A8H4QPD3_9AGAR|nr:hypothetical protein D9613_007631 [Agrocybe pediades]
MTSKPTKPIDLNDKVSKEDEIGTLIIVLLKARNLNDKHSFRKSDVFAEATLNGTHKRTHVDIKGGQRPEWDSEVRFSVHKNSAVKYRKLEVACYSQEPRSEDLMGKGELDITETLRTGEFDDWIPLEVEGVQRGEIYLEMTYYANAPAPPNKSAAASNKMLTAVQNQNGAGGLMRRPSKLSPADRLSRPPPSNYVHPQNYPPNGPLQQQGSSSRPLQNQVHASSRLHEQYQPPLPPKHSSPGSSPMQLPASLKPAHPATPPGQQDSMADYRRQHRPSFSTENAINLQHSSQPGSQGHSPSNSQTALPSVLRPGPAASGASPGQSATATPQGRPAGHNRQHSASLPPANNPGHQRTTSQGSNPYLGEDASNPYLGGGRPTTDNLAVNASGSSSRAHSPAPPGRAANYGGALSPPPDGPPLIWQQDNSVGSNTSFSFPVPMVSPGQNRPQPSFASYATSHQPTPPMASNAGYVHQHQQPPSYQYRPASSSLSGRDWEPDPSKIARYQSPLPLPPGAQAKPASTAPAKTSPAVPPKAPTPPQEEVVIPGVDRAHITELRRAEEEAARRREQEQKDLELAMALDRELNIPREDNTRSAGNAAGAMPGSWS